MVHIDNYLTEIATKNGLDPNGLQFPNCMLDPEKIKVVMVNEVPPQNPDDGFYSATADPDYMRTALGLFAAAGIQVKSMRDILEMGIYITTAVKTPKTGYAVDTGVIRAHLPILEAELALFPNLRVIMLMGDVAKKAVNLIVKAKTKKNVIPAESTYKIRQNEYYWGDIRVFPSYIMTGGTISIEKFKRDTIADDIRRMMKTIG